MKHFTFSLKMLLLSLFVVGGVNSAWADNEYTIGWGTASGDNSKNFTNTSGTVTGIVSFSTAKNDGTSAPAYNSNNSDLRLYYNSKGNGGSITLTPATGITITGFVMTTSTEPSVKYSVDGGTATSVTASSNKYTVTGISAKESLTIQNVNTSNTQLRIKTIKITYTDTRINCVTDLSLTPATIDLNGASSVTGTFIPSATEVDESGVTYSYSTTAKSGFSVNEDGTFEATARGEYTVKITANPKNETDYKAVTKEVTVEVVNSVLVITTYKKVTSEAELVLGGKYLLVYEEKSKALGVISSTTTKYGSAIDVIISGNSITIEEEAVNVLTLENGNSEDYYAFKESLEDKYLAWTSSNSLSSNSDVSNASSWSITYNGGQVTIKNKSDSNRKLQYNSSNPRFACYEGTQQDVALYRQVVSATVSNAGYATYCSNQALDFASVDGVTAYIVSAVGTDNVTLTEVESVPANTPVVVQAAAGTYNLPVIASAEAVGTNYLKVSDGSITGDGSTIFALANMDGVGFYAVANGTTIPAGKCYIDGTTETKSRLTFNFESEDATAITAIEAADAIQNGVIYNLSGQRVAHPVKGIYIQNGKKILVK